MEYVALFYTYSGALRFEKHLKEAGIQCRLMPAPRKISSSCGIGARFLLDGDINTVVNRDVEKIYMVSDKEYVGVFSDI